MTAPRLPHPPQPARPAMARPAAAGLLLAAALLAGCQGGPPAPDWQVNAVGHLERFTQAYLRGQARVAAREFTLAREETARTGRPELVARVELTRCALQVASLVFDPCTGFAPLRADAPGPEQAYADYIAGQASAAQAALLPPQHRALAASAAPPGLAALQAVTDPAALLIAAGVLMRQGRLPPGGAALAADTASRQGWRRPLLAWLGVQARLADDSGQAEEAARLRRRMDLVAPAAPTVPASAPAVPASAPASRPAP